MPGLPNTHGNASKLQVSELRSFTLNEHHLSILDRNLKKKPGVGGARL